MRGLTTTLFGLLLRGRKDLCSLRCRKELFLVSSSCASSSSSSSSCASFSSLGGDEKDKEGEPLAADQSSVAGGDGYGDDGTEKVPTMSFEELFFLHNTSLPDLRKRVLRGKVVGSNKRSVYVDVGLQRLVRFPPYELKRSKFAVEMSAEEDNTERRVQSNLHKKLVQSGFHLELSGKTGNSKAARKQTKKEGEEEARDGDVSPELAYDSQSDEVDRKMAEQRQWREAVEWKREQKRREKLQVGDHLDLEVQYLYAYDGTITAEPLDTPSLSTSEAVWNELVLAYENERPVPGRILNPVNKGFAVGIAGIVAFLPESFAPAKRVLQIGVLQWFQIVSIDRETNNILVRCAKFS